MPLSSRHKQRIREAFQIATQALGSVEAQREVLIDLLLRPKPEQKAAIGQWLDDMRRKHQDALDAIDADVVTQKATLTTVVSEIDDAKVNV